MKPEDVTSEMIDVARIELGYTATANDWIHAIAAAINAMPPAPELERLRAENEALRTALQIIAGYRPAIDPRMNNGDVARAALQEPRP